MAVSPHRGRHGETSCWASGHIKIPPSVVNWVCVCVCGGGAHVSTCLQSTYVCASPHITAKIPIHWSLEEWLLSRLEWTRRDWWSNQCPKKRGGLIVGPGTYYSEVWDRWAFFIGCIMWLQLKHNIFVLLKLMLAKMNKKSSHSCFFSL